MIRAEYLRFLQTLVDAPEAVRKVANLVADHLDDLVPLSTYQGQRAKRLVTLAQVNWEIIDPEIKPILDSHDEQATTFSQLKQLTIGPFRGFSRQETFDLASRLVLIYGQNGTGKSSFCEALEYGLLGNVTEAESKRFRDQREYLKNAYVNQFTPPRITAEDNNGNEITVSPNETAYRFCFIEKNRIDSFSRIAAQAPAKQSELISTLFGLESFTDFTRNFTAEIDDRHIDITGRNATLLSQKQQALDGAKLQIQRSNDELKMLALEEMKLANQYREGAGFNQMEFELNGDDESSGKIELLEIELQQQLTAKSNLYLTSLKTLGNSLTTIVQELRGKQKELAAASQQLSFKQLYEAVSQVQPSNPDTCPACKTPLAQTAVNPYIYAGKELQKLQQLAAIQQEEVRLRQRASQTLFDLSQIMNTCLRVYPQNNPMKPFEVANNEQPTIEWWNSLNIKLSDTYTPWQHLLFQVEQIEENDKNIDQAMKQKNKKQAELNILREYARQITILETRKKTAIAAIASDQQLIDSFNVENAPLIAAVEAEKTVITKNHIIVSAYSTFVQMLNNYITSLPAHLVADLGEIVVTLYNAFNRNDTNAELLQNVMLPLAQNQRLKISFRHQPNQVYDALHILSEGHIRCLGLAILLAKNLKENAPVLIFDDPVNAIDDDHRESIRRTLFEDSYFSNKQILLTCHGEEFFKDIQNLLPVNEANLAKSYSFLPRLEDKEIRIDFNCAPRNYIVAARASINRNEIREALAKSRQALESLTKDKVWRYVSRNGDGNLSIKLRSSSAPIELRNLTEQLKSKIEKGDFSAQNKETILIPLDVMLGINGNSREWRYLNKGTHEENDRAEFDRSTVESIVSELENLDSALE